MNGGKIGLIGAVFALIGLAVLIVQLGDFRRAGDDFSDRRTAMEERLREMERRIHGEPAQAAQMPAQQAAQQVGPQTGQQAGQTAVLPEQPQAPSQAAQMPLRAATPIQSAQGGQPAQDQPQASVPPAQAQPPVQPVQSTPAAPVQSQRRLTPEEELRAEFGRFRERADRVAAGQRAIGELLDDITRP